MNSSTVQRVHPCVPARIATRVQRAGRWAVAVLSVWMLVGCGDPMAGSVSCMSDDGCLSGDAVRCVSGACVVPRCPAGSRYVPGGHFVQGCSPSETDCTTESQPAHVVVLSSGFCLAETEVTVADYRRCLSSGRCLSPAAPETVNSLRCSGDRATWTAAGDGDESLPMSCLLWGEATAACSFVGGRLPTEAEWERAARGRDDRPFAWGRMPPSSCDQGVNFGGAGCAALPWSAMPTDRDGAMARGAFGQVDLAGNLSEWVADYFDAGAYGNCAGNCQDPRGPAQGLVRVRRGGTFLSPAAELRSYAREFHRPDGPRSDLIGVRCAFAPGP